MTQIGEGYWYLVYQISDQRVRKVEKVYLRKLSHSFGREKKQPIRWFKTAIRFIHGRKQIIKDYKYLQNNVDLKILGNPMFMGGLDYEQDAVTVVGDVFDGASLDQQKQLVDQYIENILQCWRYGFSDIIFNFTLNNGISSDGLMVLHDFNEITRDKSVVEEKIAIKRWQYAYAVRLLPNEIREYLLTQMDHKITNAALQQHWASAVKL